MGKTAADRLTDAINALHGVMQSNAKDMSIGEAMLVGREAARTIKRLSEMRSQIFGGQ